MNRKRQLTVSQRVCACVCGFTAFGRGCMRTSCPGFMFCPEDLLLSKECIKVELIDDTCCYFLPNFNPDRVCEMWFIDLNWYHLWYHFFITRSYNQQRIQSSTCTSVLTSPLSIQVRNYSHTRTHTPVLKTLMFPGQRHEIYPLTLTNTTQTDPYKNVWDFWSVWLTGLIPTSCPRLWLRPCLPTLDSPSSAACSSLRCIHHTLKPHNLTASPPMVSFKF